MIPITIFFFLVGAVLAWGFRVWILVPTTLLAMVTFVIIELAVGANAPAAIGYCLLFGPAPQIGYAFGLLVRYGLVLLRSPHSAPVAVLCKQRSLDQTG